ncbi:hypothetical protein ER308_04635 [Egibacter rhizosphaerae]|uniref:DUF4190 domain-containing protein n=1 Tax=Egibacter rhizosphaerae TaxID=1670831 RepID=A0A411YCD1_9ACTN|nr:hypothetical protein [Egibacter rhizosphaerae]QBI18901.1 hypothetical protein ER308_04635 [Egibacter rhizosphaerae]
MSTPPPEGQEPGREQEPTQPLGPDGGEQGGPPPSDPAGWQSVPPPGAAPPADPGGWRQEPVPAPSGNGLSTAALVCGILALLAALGGFLLLPIPLAIILGLVAVILGIVGMRRAPARGGTGRGTGIAGLVMGGLGLLGGILWIVLFVAIWTQVVDDPEFQELLERIERGEIDWTDIDDDDLDDLDDLDDDQPGNEG